MQKWLANSVLYQIYPTSFYDGNGDGIGDLVGITERLDYVKDLGVDIVWLNPIFQSPFKDGGYDISNYYDIDGRFGTMEDFEGMIAKAKSLNLKVCLDLVIGHTSWEHEWFKKSAERERNAYSNYYIWTDSIFQTYKDKTISGLYERNGCFYVNYYASQPALNYGFNDTEFTNAQEKGSYEAGDSWKLHYTDERLAPLREEIFNVIRFWVNKGADGFRVDMANSLVKGCVWNSNKDEDIEGLKWVWSKILPQMRREFPDIFFIAEWCYPKNAVGKCGFDIDLIAHDVPEWNSLFRCEKGMNLLPAFEQGRNYFSAKGCGSVEGFLRYAQDVNQTIRGKGFFSAPTGSHDEIRLATGKSVDEIKTAFAFLLTMQHVPFIYYGDEIGIRHDFSVSRDGGYIRTGARTPMQWDESRNRGFSENDHLYLPTNEDEGCSVESQKADKNSLLNTVKELIRLRKKYPCLGAEGEFRLVTCEKGGYPLVYERYDAKEKICVVISPAQKRVEYVFEQGEVIYSNNCAVESGRIVICGVGFAIIRKKGEK